MIYVLNIHGEPLMSTKRHGKVRHLLKEGKAKVIKKTPFTIQLLYKTTDYVQPVTLGVDAGSKYIGLSATTEQEELYAADVELRTDIVKLLATRRENRRARRSRKTRYRAPRFNNRIVAKKENRLLSSSEQSWLAPSIRQRIECHMTVVRNVCKILPISKIIVETASFDIQKIKNPAISGKEYQEGDLSDFWNIREYVLFRDGHTCQCCKGKSKNKILNVHHIESRKTGGDSPGNLITLCETCHTGYHKGTVMLPKTIKRGMSFRDAAFMGIMRWAFYEQLKEEFADVSMTYGYITKMIRIKCGLSKAHHIDARCISGHPEAKPVGIYYYQKKVRCHNRQIHKMTILKGNVRKLNQAPYLVKGFRLYDKVEYQKKQYFIFGRRSSGYFDIRDLSGNKINKGSISYKKLKLIETQRSYLTEIRKELPVPQCA